MGWTILREFWLLNARYYIKFTFIHCTTKPGFIADTLGIDNTYKHYAEELNFHIYDVFYDENTRLCYDYPEHKAYSQLGNALAILCGTIDGEKAAEICDKLFTDKTMTPRLCLCSALNTMHTFNGLIRHAFNQ